MYVLLFFYDFRRELGATPRQYEEKIYPNGICLSGTPLRFASSRCWPRGGSGQQKRSSGAKVTAKRAKESSSSPLRVSNQK